MNKNDIKMNMFVSVIQNTSSLSKNRAKIKRIGRVIGVYNRYANLQLFESSDLFDTDKVIVYRKLYNESFRFSEISEFKGKVIFEKKGRLK